LVGKKKQDVAKLSTWFIIEQGILIFLANYLLREHEMSDKKNPSDINGPKRRSQWLSGHK